MSHAASTRRSCFVGVAFSILALGSLPVPVSAQSEVLSERLDQLRATYRRMKTVRFQAESVIVIGKESRLGKIEYWAEGAMERTNVQYKSFSGEDIALDYGYDGERYQRLDREVSFLRYQKAPQNREPFALPNPLLAPVGFLLPNGLEREGAKLLLSDVQADRSWAEVLKNTRVMETNATGLLVEIKSVDSLGETYISRVQFGADPSYLPVRIERTAQKAGKNAIFIVDEYRRQVCDGEALYWPAKVRILAGQNGRVLGELRITVTRGTLNAPNPKGVFTLSTTSADTIYDEDLRTFIRSKRDFRLPPEMDANESRVSASTRMPATKSLNLPNDANVAGNPEDNRGVRTKTVSVAGNIRLVGLVLVAIGLAWLGVAFRRRLITK